MTKPWVEIIAQYRFLHDPFLPVEDYRPHASATAIHRDVYTKYLVHPRYVSKPKVQHNERSDERSEDWVRDAQDQNEQVIGVLQKKGQ